MLPPPPKKKGIINPADAFENIAFKYSIGFKLPIHKLGRRQAVLHLSVKQIPPVGS
jgi:hypothetical protein